MPTPLDRYIMDSPLPMPTLLAVPTMLELSLEPPMLPLPILDMLDMLDMLVSEILDMLLPLLPMVIPVLDIMDMASVKLKLIPMPTPLDRLHMDSQSPTPSLLVMPTMLELSLGPPMLPLPILDILAILDIMPMLVLDTLVLAILEPTLDKLRRNWIADDLNSSFNNKLPKH